MREKLSSAVPLSLTKQYFLTRDTFFSENGVSQDLTNVFIPNLTRVGKTRAPCFDHGKIWSQKC